MEYRATEEAWQGAKELWLTGKSQPNACDKLFGVWRASGTQDRWRIWSVSSGDESREYRSGDGAGRADARAIPETIASAIISLANDPNSVMTFARTTGATDFTRQMAAVAFASVARQDVENARLMIPSLCRRNSLMTSKPRSCATLLPGA